MSKQHLSKNNAGTTLVELTIATAVFGVSMMLLLGNVLTMSNHNTVADERALAASFSRSTLEDIRGRTLEDILTYQTPVDNPNTNTVLIPGLGEAAVTVYAIIPTDGGTRFFQLGVDDPAGLVDVPSPLELRVDVAKVISCDSSMTPAPTETITDPYSQETMNTEPAGGYAQRSSMNYSTSTYVYYR